MAHDENLTAEFRAALSAHLGNQRRLEEKKMMGGVCFMLDGNMVGGADRTKDGDGRFMFRVGKDNETAGAALPGAQPMVTGGRRMSGFFFVDEAECNDEVMSDWLDLTLGFVKTLPKK